MVLSEKMKQEWFYIGFNLILAIGILLCAILGQTMGIDQGPALAISVVWPATGFSLAALLLFGYEAAIGVFLGNFVYNFLFFSYPSVDYLSTFHKVILATCISFGSLLEALAGAYIIRTYSTPLIFRTVKDVFIFLIPASLLACLIGSTIGVASLAIGGGLDKSLILPVWLTFWLGDTVGIYVITPLLVVFTLRSQKINFSDHLLAVVCMLFFLLVFSFATYFSRHTLPHLFVPISIWAAYLFRMYGASLIIFIMTAISISFAIFFGFRGTSLISPITFIGVTVVVSLIIAAIANEREEAWDLLNSRNIYLRKEVDVKKEILQQVHSEISQKKKLANRGVASKFLKEQVDSPLSKIERISKASEAALQEIQKFLEEQKNLTSAEKLLVADNLQKIKQGLDETLESQKTIAELFRFLTI